MGCFFDCFRRRDDRPSHLVRRSSRAISREGISSQNRLSSLFLSEDSLGFDKDGADNESNQIEKALKDEARFLKACGTIPETPTEIRKASEKSGNSIGDANSQFTIYKPWLSDTPVKVLDLDKQLDQQSTPGKLCEDLPRRSNSLEQTPTSCLSNDWIGGNTCPNSRDEEGSGNGAIEIEANETDKILPSTALGFSAGNTQGRNRAVRFEVDFDSSPSSVSYENGTENTSKPRARYGATFSPNPTPLKLSDEMQTPGTIFPRNPESLAHGKVRIRSHYAYSVPNLIESSQFMVPQGSKSSQSLAVAQDFVKQTPNLRTEVNEVEQSSAERELKVEASSSWLKQKPSALNESERIFGGTSSKDPPFGRTPGDRPIIGMVAAHWNEEEIFHNPPKWWDGHGIPNSTNKYKEDQKVNWHATPFEERLEKALSQESHVSQRRPVKGPPVVFDDNESDTAMSQLRPSAPSRSVVSF